MLAWLNAAPVPVNIFIYVVYKRFIIFFKGTEVIVLFILANS